MLMTGYKCINDSGRLSLNLTLVLWQNEDKCASRVQLALGPDRSSMSLHHPMRNRQPKSCSARLTRPRLVHAIKPFKDAAQVLRCNPLAKVAYAKLHAAFRLCQFARAYKDA